MPRRKNQTDNIKEAIDRVPWDRIFFAVTWAVEAGKQRVEDNLTAKQRDELVELLKKSKGNPGNLTKRQRDRLIWLGQRAVLGKR
jgi:hypothetical protein